MLWLSITGFMHSFKNTILFKQLAQRFSNRQVAEFYQNASLNLNVRGPSDSGST